MRDFPSIAIIGAGVAGLACARELAMHGIEPVIFDKGRGLGGRLSTRRAEGGCQFDHGAQYLTAEGDGFGSVLRDAEAAGAVARWSLDDEPDAFVGVPGMTGFAKFLAGVQNIRKGLRIRQLSEMDGGWRLQWDGGAEVFDRVVVTAPPPQTIALLPENHALVRALDAVEMNACLALMLAMPAGEDIQFVARRDPSDDLAWIALDSAKPGRPDATCLVAHASPDWSSRHLELDMHEIASRMLPLVAQVLGRRLKQDVPYLSAHRWRYALVSRPLGQPCLADRKETLFAGGDWCLGARAEDAWNSGTAIADAVMKAL